MSGRTKTLGEALLGVLRPEVEQLVTRLVEEQLRDLRASFDAASASTWLTTAQAARYLSLSPEALRARVRRGTVPAHRDEGRWLFHRDELDNTIRRRSDPPLQ